MIGQWPSAWREVTLRNLGLNISPRALTALSAWQLSTPVQPWTNNPLGMPAFGNGAPRALNTAYASFPTMDAFYKALVIALSHREGIAVKEHLANADDYGALWRSINALKWPANDTETDHPSRMLDLLELGYRESLQSVPPNKRRTAGIAQPKYSPGTVLHAAASELRQVTAAMEAQKKTTKRVYKRGKQNG